MLQIAGGRLAARAIDMRNVVASRNNHGSGNRILYIDRC